MRTEITTKMMAVILGYTGEHRVRNARDWMRARGIDMQHVKGGQVFTTEEHLREVAPHLWLKWKEAKDTYERENSGGLCAVGSEDAAGEDRVLRTFYEAIHGSAGSKR